MSDLIKNLLLKASWLLLILSAHFGLLSMVFGYSWIKLFYYEYRTELLLSALALSFFYAVSFHLFRALKQKKNYAVFCLYSITAISLIFLVYSVFFSPENLQEIIASTVSFLGVIAFIAFCDSRKSSAVWKNLQRISATALLITGLIFLHTHYNLVSYLKSPLLTSGETKFKAKESLTSTAFYQIHRTTYHMADYYIPAPLSNIPAYISALDNKNFLLIDRSGNIYHLTLKPNPENTSPEENLHIRKLSATFPINYKQLGPFDGNRKIPKRFFSITDIYTDVENGRLTLYVGHHFWNGKEKCFTLRLSKLRGDVSALLEDKALQKWRTLYETTPCFPPKKTGTLFLGHQAGGKIVGLDDDALLFSVGDHGWDMLDSPENFPQDINGSYGKIWKINRNTGEADLVSLGHRNPQGLYHAPDGAIWETEHGPQGGDELNKIKMGKNYGWPHVLYGTNYGQLVWPFNANQDEHEGYEQPVFAWTPSIAVSSLIGVEGDLFPIWKNDLLVSSLKNRTLYRLQMHEDRVIYSEPIKIGRRIRDLAETPNGEIFIWTDNQNMIRLRPAGSLPKKDETIAEAGERLFHKCAGCHNIKQNTPHGIGPNLHKIYKSRIARHGEYDYSPMLQARSAERWTRENLDLFLQDPESFAPGTTMQMKVPDDYERRALLHYLENN